MDQDAPVKAEDGADRKPAGYKSWKKKYRKMRITFDRKMHDGEELHRHEAKASAMVKRLATENDRLLDILLEINNSPQIPMDKRMDLSLEPPSDPKTISPPADPEHAKQKEHAMKRLQDLSEIPHLSYSSAQETHPSYVKDLSAPEGESFPANFLSADDVDNYIHEVDIAMEAENHLPSVAPRAHRRTQQTNNPHLKNPTSVTNWLRKHAPKIFLQDGESHGHQADGDDGDGGGGGGGTGGGTGTSSTRKAKSSASKPERAGRSGGARVKRASAASKSATAAAHHERDRDRGDWDASMDDDPDFGSTPVPASKGKRKRDDDPGYRPKGGSSSRPAKKKRKSDADSTPSVRKSKKESASASKDD